MPDLTVKHGCKNQTELTQLAVKKQRKSAKSALGFSLLELLVVISLLGIVAMAATTLIIDSGEEKRKDATEKQWDAIRKAMLADSTLTLNNSPVISGYVADMGRLPSNLKELISRVYDHDDNPATPDIVQPAYNSIQLSSVEPLATGSISGGWRGPYLYTAGSAEFRDGWLNKNNGNLVDDAINFGWFVSATAAAIQVQSLGEGNAVGGSEYGADFPSAAVLTVNENDWLLTSASGTNFNVVFNKPPAADQTNLQVRIYFFEDDMLDNADNESVSEEIGVVGPLPTDTFFGVSATATSPSVQTVNVDYPLPVGKYAALVFCTDGASPTNVSAVYDGDCNLNVAPTVEPQPYYFTILPKASTSPIVIPWNIP